MAALPAAASAQIATPDPAMYAPDYGSLITQDTLLRQSLGQPGRGAKAEKKTSRQRRKNEGKRPPSARQRAMLRFTPAATVSQEIDAFFMENFAAPGAAPELVAADLAGLRATAAGDLGRLRWSTGHLGDAAAYALLVGYMVVNGETKLDPSGVKALRLGLRDELAAMRSVRRLSDARQQRLAEILVLRVGYYVGWRNSRLDSGDAGGAEALVGDLRSFVEKVYGIDLAELRLGRRGFVPRS